MRRNFEGTHDTKHYNLGRGIVYFAPSLGADGKPDEGWVDLGNCTEFNVSINIEELDHKSSRTGVSITDVKIVTSREVSINFTLDSVTGENVARYLGGEVGTKDNSIHDTAIVAEGHPIASPAAVGGRWYDIFDAAGNRVYDTGVITIDGPAGIPTGVEGTHFISEPQTGRFFIPKDSPFVNSILEVSVVANAGAATSMDVVSGPVADKVGALAFIAENPNDADDFKWGRWEFFRTRLKASGDLPLISDEWSSLTLEGTAEENTGSGYTGYASKVMEVVMPKE